MNSFIILSIMLSVVSIFAALTSVFLVAFNKETHFGTCMKKISECTICSKVSDKAHKRLNDRWIYGRREEFLMRKLEVRQLRTEMEN